MELPSNVLDKMNIISELQDNLKELEEENYSTTLQSILESPFFSENDIFIKVSRYHQFWENTHVCLRERPKSFFLFVRIIIDIFHVLEKQDFENPFLISSQGQIDGQKYDQINSQTIILSQQVQSECSNIDFKNNGNLFAHIFIETTKHRAQQFFVHVEEPQLLLFTYHLYRNGFFNNEKLYSFLKDIKKDPSTSYYSSYAFFNIFAPEVEEKDNSDPGFFGDLHEGTRFVLNYQQITQFQSHFDEYKANNWEKFRQFRNSLDFGNITLQCLINDDIDLFRDSVSSYPDFNPNMELELPLFAPFDYISHKPPIIGAAAFFGSDKIFKYLKMLGASLACTDSLDHTVVQFAAAGGNLEIIRLLEQEKQNVEQNSSTSYQTKREFISFEGALQVSSGFSRYNIFEWLLETQNYDISSVDKSRGNVIGHASLENNPRLLQRCMEENVDVNGLDANQRFPILKTITYRAYDTFRYLLFIPETDLSLRYKNQCLVAISVKTDEDWITKILLDDDRTILSEADTFNILIEMICNISIKCFRNVLTNHHKYNMSTAMSYNCLALKLTILHRLITEEFFLYFYKIDPNFFNNLSYYEIVASHNFQLLNFMISSHVGDINANKGKALFCAIKVDDKECLLALLKADSLDLTVKCNLKKRQYLPHEYAKHMKDKEMYKIVVIEMKKRNLIDQNTEETFEIVKEEEEEEFIEEDRNDDDDDDDEEEEY